MKIVHVFWSLHFGGIENMLVNLANAQSTLGVEVNIILTDKGSESIMLNSISKEVNVYCLNRNRGSKYIGFIIKLNLLLQDLAPDAIHLHDSRFYGMIWSNKLSRVASVTLHALPTGSVRRGGLLFRLFPILNINAPGLVTYLDKIPQKFCISEAVRQLLWDNYHIESKVIINGINTKSFKQRNLEKFKEQFKIIQVSRLVHDKKGQDLLVKAAIMLKGTIDVTFIGDGPSRNYLQNLVTKNKAERYIHIIGSQTQSYLKSHLCDYDLFIQPSRWEGFGLTVAEAMSACLPVLVSSGQGPAEVTKGEKYGWVFENDNIEDLILKIKWIHDNYDVALQKAKNARVYTVETFDILETAKQYIESY